MPDLPTPGGPERMTAHWLTPTEMGREFGMHRREVITRCVEWGVPIFQGRIDKAVFAAKKKEAVSASPVSPEPERATLPTETRAYSPEAAARSREAALTTADAVLEAVAGVRSDVDEWLKLAAHECEHIAAGEQTVDHLEEYQAMAANASAAIQRAREALAPNAAGPRASESSPIAEPPVREPGAEGRTWTIYVCPRHGMVHRVKVDPVDARPYHDSSKCMWAKVEEVEVPASELRVLRERAESWEEMYHVERAGLLERARLLHAERERCRGLEEKQRETGLRYNGAEQRYEECAAALRECIEAAGAPVPDARWKYPKAAVEAVRSLSTSPREDPSKCRFCERPAAQVYAGVPVCAEPSKCRARLGPPDPPDPPPSYADEHGEFEGNFS